MWQIQENEHTPGYHGALEIDNGPGYLLLEWLFIRFIRFIPFDTLLLMNQMKYLSLFCQTWQDLVHNISVSVKLTYILLTLIYTILLDLTEQVNVENPGYS